MTGSIYERTLDNGVKIEYAVITIDNDYVIIANNMFMQRYIDCGLEDAIEEFFTSYSEYVEYEIVE